MAEQQDIWQWLMENWSWWIPIAIAAFSPIIGQGIAIGYDQLKSKGIL